MRTILLLATCGGLIVGIASIERCSMLTAASGPSRSLAFAVEAFNARSATHFASEHQPPLSQKEVLDAIELWRRQKEKAISSHALDQIVRTAKTGIMPITARLHKTMSRVPNGEDWRELCTIRLTVLDDRGKPHAVPIRAYLLRGHHAPPARGPVSDTWPEDCL